MLAASGKLRYFSLSQEISYFSIKYYGDKHLLLPAALYRKHVAHKNMSSHSLSYLYTSFLAVLSSTDIILLSMAPYNKPFWPHFHMKMGLSLSLSQHEHYRPETRSYMTSRVNGPFPMPAVLPSFPSVCLVTMRKKEEGA